MRLFDSLYRARLQMDDDIQTGEDNTNYSQTDDVKAPDVSTSQKHARLPDHLHYEDTHGAQNIIFPPEVGKTFVALVFSPNFMLAQV